MLFPAAFLPVAFECLAPNALIVLDRSRSMEDFLASGEPKWSVAVDVISSVVMSFDDRVRFGIGTFPDDAFDCAPGRLRMPVGDGQGQAIASYVQGDGPDGYGTPIADSLVDISRAEPALADSTRDNFVILVTDGEETCDGDPVTSVQTLRGRSPEVRTFVIGFGENGLNDVELDALAEAGGTAQTGAATKYFQASDRDALAAALDQIATAVTGGDPEFPSTCGADPGGSGGEDLGAGDGTGSGSSADEDGEESGFTSGQGACACRVGTGAGSGSSTPWWLILALIPWVRPRR